MNRNDLADAFDPEGSDSETEANDVFPTPNASITRRTQELAFPPIPPVKLYVDAKPGCGGIAWPAGEVHLIVLPGDLV